MKRYSDWWLRLNVYLSGQQERPFSYGDFDCCLFAAGGVLAMTGVDLAARFRGCYRTRREARGLTGPDLRRWLQRELAAAGLIEVAPLLTQRGDLAFVERGKTASLGLVSLTGRSVLLATDKGLLAASISHASLGWRV